MKEKRFPTSNPGGINIEDHRISFQNNEYECGDLGVIWGDGGVEAVSFCIESVCQGTYGVGQEHGTPKHWKSKNIYKKLYTARFLERSWTSPE